MSQNNIWGELLQSIAPNQNIRDYQHASRTFIDGLYRLSPKLNNLFHVFIDINPSLPYNDPLNPNHTIEERTQNWTAILKEFSTNSIDYTGLDNYRAIGWQRQLHLFEVPFYYIEYGIAQLGAIARPSHVYVVAALPKTRSGKIVRRALQAVAEGRDPGDISTMEDQNVLAQIKTIIEQRASA